MMLLALFGIGFVLDLFWASCVQACAERRVLPAVVSQIGHTGLALVATWIVVAANTVPGACLYVLGCACGTFVIVKFRRKK
jgi:hypothetical protein